MANYTPTKTSYVAKPVAERFAKKYRIDPSGCWQWIGTCFRKKGVDVAAFKLPRVAKGQKSRTVNPARLSFELHKGAIPPGAFVLHSCDNRMCVNPDHLSLGDHKQNMREVKERLRGALGSRNYNSKLTDDRVRELRRLFGSMPIEDLASKFGITPACACMAICRYTWRHVS